jgi:hypothetical protein
VDLAYPDAWYATDPTAGAPQMFKWRGSNTVTIKDGNGATYTVGAKDTSFSMTFAGDALTRFNYTVA